MLLERQSWHDDGVSAFAHDLDLAVGTSHDHTHAFAIAVELDHVQQLISLLIGLVLVVAMYWSSQWHNVNDDIFVATLATSELIATMFGKVAQRQLVR